MHELSIAMSILDVAREESEKRGGVRVDAIHLRVGALSGVVSDALLSAYDLAREQTEFTGCRLVIEEVPAVIYCSKCAAERPVHSLQWFCCAECESPATQVVSGRELQVSALEIVE
jgi:hydrogenase nickel incorporation protein HypA/HybF